MVCTGVGRSLREAATVQAGRTLRQLPRRDRRDEVVARWGQSLLPGNQPQDKRERPRVAPGEG